MRLSHSQPSRRAGQLELPVLDSGPAPAAFATLDERQRGTVFLDLPVRSVLNSPAATGMGFWSVNPYIGCEFGCTYCYARDTHRWAIERAASHVPADSEPAAALGEVTRLPAWEAFERRILVKRGAAEVLARTLDPHRVAGDTIVIGTATDPYQPAERRFRLTRSVLEMLRAHRGLSIGLITKSPLVVRDLDVLRQLATRHEVSVNISLATFDPALARRLELRSPVPRARLRALERLTAGGIHAGLLIAPILPGITDDRAGLDRLFAAARAAGAHYAVGGPLRLGPAARERFLPHLAREFPHLAERYRRHYERRQTPTKAYCDALKRRLEELQRKHGFPVSASMRQGPTEAHAAPAEQAGLWE